MAASGDRERLGDIFEGALKQDLEDLSESAEKLGDRLVTAVIPFRTAMAKTAEALNKAVKMKQPDETAIFDFFEPVAAQMEIVTEIMDGTLPKDLLESHIVALGETIKALEWLPSSDPLSVLATNKTRLESSLEPLRKKALAGNDVHQAFLEALESVYSNIESFVKTNCPQGIPWQQET